MKLRSTLLGKLHSATWGNPLRSEVDLFPDRGAIRYVSVISAYTDINMLTGLFIQSLKRADNRCGVQIRIFLDRFASTYETSKTVKDQMDSLAKKIQEKGASGSGIWLVKVGSLFHSKAVVVETNSSVTCMVGSLNMTAKAFTRNEELVLFGLADLKSRSYDSKVAQWISGEYCSALLSQSEQVPFVSTKNDCESLQNLMLAGVIFHDVKESDPFRFQFGLPDEFLEVKQNVHPLMKAALNDSISIESIITGRVEDGGLGCVLPIDKARSGESWKKYCLDTCYGFWCPGQLRDSAQRAIDGKRRLRLPRFEGTKEQDGLFSIIRLRQADITECFGKILQSLNAQVIKSGVPLDDWNPDRVAERWGVWYRRLREKLENREIRDRIILGVSLAPVPNVWSDPVTSKEFETSFIESLQFASTKGDVSSRTKKVISILTDTYDLDPEIIRTTTTLETLLHFENQLSAHAKG